MDPVSDFIIRLKNAGMAGKKDVSMPYSTFLYDVAEALKKRGFIEGVEKKGKKAGTRLEITLSYTEEGKPRITDVDRISKPGRRVYRSAGDIKPVRGGRGALLISTPKGVLTDMEAKKEHVGGEALFKIW